MLLEPRDEFAVRRLATELGIDLIVITKIIAVRAAGLCPQVGRAINVADAQLMQIRDNRRRVVERETAVKLQSIRRRGASLPLANLLNDLQRDRERSWRR